MTNTGAPLSLNKPQDTDTGKAALEAIAISMQAINDAFPSKIVTNVKDFGAVGDGTTDDTAAIQAAIDAVDNAGGGTITVPTGIYKITSMLTMAGHSTLQGASVHGSVLTVDGATDFDVVRVTGGGGGVRDLQIVHTGTAPTAGAAIHLYAFNTHNIVSNCYLENNYYGVAVRDAIGWIISNCNIHSCVKAGVYINNVAHPDQGCGTIYGCAIGNAESAGIYGVHWQSGGAVNITNNTLLGSSIAVYVQIRDSLVATSDIFIANNMIEAFTTVGIKCEQVTGGDGGVFNLLITGNELGVAGGDCISVGRGFHAGVIANNVLQPSSHEGIIIKGAYRFEISGNYIESASIGIHLLDDTAHCDTIDIADSNTCFGCIVDFQNDGVFRDHRSIRKVTNDMNTNSTSVYTYVCEISLSPYSACTVEFVASLFLATVGVASRYVKKLCSIENTGGTITVTDITDVAGLGVFDLNFDVGTGGMVRIGIKRNAGDGNGTSTIGAKCSILITGEVAKVKML